MKKCIFLFCLIFFSISIQSNAAIQKEDKKIEVNFSNEKNEPFEELKSDKKTEVNKLAKIIFSKKYSQNERWNSLMTLENYDYSMVKNLLEKSLIHPTWFIRAGGLRVLTKLDSINAKKWSLKLLDDPALLVRSDAVEMMEKINDKEFIPYLWSELDRKRNFRGKHSIWIRKKIVKLLVKLETQFNQSKIEYLKRDPDPEIRKIAVNNQVDLLIK